jgi:IS5 family transposase
LDEVSDRASFRQFVGLDLTDNIPDRTSLVKFRMKLGLELIQNFFDSVLQQCIELNLVGFENSVFDGTIVKARAQIKSGRDQRYVEQTIKTNAKEYCKEYFEINNDETFVDLDRTEYPKDRGSLGGQRGEKLPVSQLISKGDPDARFIRKNGKSVLGYQSGYKVDVKEGIITDVVAIPASSDMAKEYYDILTAKSKDKQISADREFYENKILKYCSDNNIKCNIPVKTNPPTNGVLDKSHFNYDKENDCYFCPENKMLKRAQQHKKQEEIYYRTSLENCRNCPIKNKCTSGKQRTIARSFYEDLNEKHKEYTKTPEFVKGIVLRKIISEGKFGEAKNNYGLRFAKYVGLKMMKLQTFFTACIQNCVRMLKLATANGTI